MEALAAIGLRRYALNKIIQLKISAEYLKTLKDNPDPDAKVLWQLLQHGSDLTKEHEPDFAFSTDNIDDAHGIADELSALGFEVKIYPPEEEHPNFEIVGIKRMILDLSKLQEMSQQFENIAIQNNGKYLGWGTEIEE